MSKTYDIENIEVLCDFKVDSLGNFLIGTDGDIEVVTGSDCVVQDIRNELTSLKGELFYDDSYGGNVLNLIHSQDSEMSRLELIQNITKIISKNEFVISDSIKCTITSWELDSVNISALFNLTNYQSVQLGISILDEISVEVK